MRLLQLFIFGFCVSSLLFAGPVQDVEKLTTKLKELSEPTIEIIDHVRKLSSEAKLFAQFLGPAASLIVTALDLAIEDESSPELKAIKSLQSSVDVQFNDLTLAVSRLDRRSLAHSINLAYIDHVDLPLVGMKQALDRLGKGKPENVKKSFLDQCLGDDSPRKALNWLKRVTIDACETTTPTAMLHYSSIISKLTELEAKTNFKSIVKGGFLLGYTKCGIFICNFTCKVKYFY